MLEIENLSYLVQRRCLLDSLYLSFKPSFLHGIIGPNGAGKSTFFKVLKRILTPTGGEIYWEGQSLHTLSLGEISKLITLVPQNPSIHFHFTVEEFVMMGRYSHEKKHDLVEWALSALALIPLRKQDLLSLSGGERQRAYIARSLVTEASILLLDEPTANLDFKHQEAVWEILAWLTKQGKTVLISTHDLIRAYKHCHFLTLFSEGKSLSQCTPDEFLNSPYLMERMGVVKNLKESYT